MLKAAQFSCNCQNGKLKNNILQIFIIRYTISLERLLSTYL